MSPLESVINKAGMTKYQFQKKFNVSPYYQKGIKLERVIEFAKQLDINEFSYQENNTYITIEFKKINEMQVKAFEVVK